MAGTVDLTSITGPMLCGHLFNWGLFGILTAQIYAYYVAFPHDSARLKGVVGMTYTLELIQLIFATHDVFRVYANGWGNFLELDSIGFYWFDIIILTALISVICQLFYAWRIRVLNNSYAIASVIAIISVIELAVALYDGVVARQLGWISALTNPRVYRTGIAWAGISLVCSLIITVSMTFRLWQMKKCSSKKKTGTVITRLMKLTVETGFICTATSIASVTLFVTSHTTSGYTIPLFMLSKLYSNCLLAVVNSRIQIVGGRVTVDTTIMDDLAIAPALESLRFHFGLDDTGKHGDASGTSLTTHECVAGC